MRRPGSRTDGWRTLARACCALLLAMVIAPVPVSGQLRGDSPPEFAGGYDPRYCAYPREPKRAGISGCCLMTLQISAAGRVTDSTGECTDPVFLEPARLCLAAQHFRPARRGGQPVAAEHRMEYEWRSSRGDSVCGRLKLS